jgi:hypothetical protein
VVPTSRRLTALLSNGVARAASSRIEDERHIRALSELFSREAAMLKGFERPLGKPVRKFRNAVEVWGGHQL